MYICIENRFCEQCLIIRKWNNASANSCRRPQFPFSICIQNNPHTFTRIASCRCKLPQNSQVQTNVTLINRIHSNEKRICKFQSVWDEPGGKFSAVALLKLKRKSFSPVQITQSQKPALLKTQPTIRPHKPAPCMNNSKKPKQ